MPDGFFTAEALENYIACANSARGFVRISDLFPKSKQLMKSALSPLHGASKMLRIWCLPVF